MWGGAGTGKGAPRPQPTPAGRLEAPLRVGARRRIGRRARGTAREGGSASAGAPRSPVAGKARAPRPAAWGRGGRACGLLGEFSPGLACDSRPGPRPRGPGCPVETHRKGPDPHLGVLPAARAFAQIRHGARPLPGGGCGSHSEAPVSHLRRAGRRGATLGAAARPPVGLGSWPAPGRPRRGRRRLGLRRLGLSWGAALTRLLRGVPLTPGSAPFIALLRDGGGGGDGQTSHCASRTSSSFSSSASARRDPAQRVEGGGGREESRRVERLGGGRWEDRRRRTAAAGGRSDLARRGLARDPGRGGAKPGGGGPREEGSRGLGKWEGPAGRGGGKGAGLSARGVSCLFDRGASETGFWAEAVADWWRVEVTWT